MFVVLLLQETLSIYLYTRLLLSFANRSLYVTSVLFLSPYQAIPRSTETVKAH